MEEVNNKILTIRVIFEKTRKSSELIKYEEFEDNVQPHDICEITGAGGTCGV